MHIIFCDIHGSAPSAYLCLHLTADRHDLEFIEQDAGASAATGWCDGCERHRRAMDEDDWDEYLSDVLRRVCHGCFNAARMSARRLRDALDGGHLNI